MPRVAVLAAVLLLVSCAEREIAEPSEASRQPCRETVETLVDELDGLIADQGSIELEDFLSGSMVGLDEFQGDIATAISTRNPACRDRDLDQAFAEQLDAREPASPVEQLLIETLRFEGQREVKQVVIEPGDPLVEILALLAPGSEVTLTEGTFELDQTLFVTGDLTLSGTGAETTVLRTSAPEAGIVVLEEASVGISGMTVEHSGEVPASTILVAGGALDVGRVHLTGAVSDGAESGGVGLLLSAEAPQRASAAIVNSTISDNEVAGVAATGAVAVSIESSSVEGNACGACWFDGATGSVLASTLVGNEIGVQASGGAELAIDSSELSRNQSRGLVVDGATVTIDRSTLADNGEVGTDLRAGGSVSGSAVAVTGQPVGVNLADAAQAELTDWRFGDVEIAVQAAGSSAVATQAVIVESATRAGVLLGERASLSSSADQISIGDQGVGVIIAGTSTANIDDLVVKGGGVGLTVAERAQASIAGGSVSDVTTGLEVRDTAEVSMAGVAIERATGAAGIIEAGAIAELIGLSITEPTGIGLQIAAETASVVDTEITGGETGILLLGASQAEVRESRIVGQQIAIEVTDSATPTLAENRISGATAIAVSYSGQAAGTLSGNWIVDPGVLGVQITDSAAPLIEGNFLGGPAALDPDVTSVGLLWAGQATGVALDNEILGFLVGVQAGERAAPTITENEIEGGSLRGVGVLYGGDATGLVEANRLNAHVIAIQVGDSAGPSLIGNQSVAEQADVLFDGEAAGSVEAHGCGGAGIVVLGSAVPEVGPNGDCVIVQG